MFSFTGYQVFRLRPGQTAEQLFEAAPLLAVNTPERLQWLGEGYYFWGSPQVAFAWGKKRYSCLAKDLVVIECLIECPLVFDFQTYQDHVDILIESIAILNERATQQDLSLISCGRVLAFLVANNDELTPFPYQGTVYRMPVQKPADILLAPHTSARLYFCDVIFCVFAAYVGTIVKTRVVPAVDVE